MINSIVLTLWLHASCIGGLQSSVLVSRRWLSLEESVQDGSARRRLGSYPTILFSGYSMMPTAPCLISCGMSSRTTSSLMTLSTANHSVL